MNKEIKAVFDYVTRVSPWPDNTPDQVVWECAERAAKDLLDAEHTKLKQVFRLSGQSGCGKTTQLLPSILMYQEQQGNKPIVIAVRTFPKYHPSYEEILCTAPAGELRERTNGFALKCLAACLNIVFRAGALVILDLTILDPIFEEFIVGQIWSSNYDAQFHILAVSREQSNAFIEARERGEGRVVYKATSDYFFDILPKGLGFLASADRTSHAIVWTAYDKEPIYAGNLQGATKALQQGRAMRGELRYNEDELRAAKVNYLIAKNLVF